VFVRSGLSVRCGACTLGPGPLVKSSRRVPAGAGGRAIAGGGLASHVMTCAARSAWPVCGPVRRHVRTRGPARHQGPRPGLVRGRVAAQRRRPAGARPGPGPGAWHAEFPAVRAAPRGAPGHGDAAGLDVPRGVGRGSAAV